MDLIVNIVVFGLFALFILRRALRQNGPESAYSDEDSDEEEEVVRRPPPRPSYKRAPPPVPFSTPPRQSEAKIPDNSTAYDIKQAQLATRANHLIADLPELKNMLIYYEIFGPPKAFRDDR